jgi:hypothetical protein
MVGSAKRSTQLDGNLLGSMSGGRNDNGSGGGLQSNIFHENAAGSTVHRNAAIVPSSSWKTKKVIL